MDAGRGSAELLTAQRFHPGDNAAVAMKSPVLDASEYDWEGDSPLHPTSRSVIYEMHVRGFTRHGNSGVATERRRTYAGVIDKIPYLLTSGLRRWRRSRCSNLPCPAGRVNY